MSFILRCGLPFWCFLICSWIESKDSSWILPHCRCYPLLNCWLWPQLHRNAVWPLSPECQGWTVEPVSLFHCHGSQMATTKEKLVYWTWADFLKNGHLHMLEFKKQSSVSGTPVLSYRVKQRNTNLPSMLPKIKCGLKPHPCLLTSM